MNISNTVKYPLHLAAALGDLSGLKSLLEGKAKYDVNALDELNLTPLHIAALYGDRAMVVFLLSKGADPTINNGYDQNFSALDLAVIEGNQDIVSLLVDNQPTRVLQNMHLEHAMLCSLDTLSKVLENGDISLSDFNVCIDIFSTLAQAQVKTGNAFLIDLSCELPFCYPQEVYLEPIGVWLEALAAFAPNKVIYNLLMEQRDYINEHDSSYYRYIEAKSLLHVLPVDDFEYTLSYESSTGPVVSNINCHGFMICFMAPFVSHEIDAYKATLNPIFDAEYKVFEDLSMIYEHAALLGKEPFVFENSELAYQWYQEGQTVLLPTGWEGHAVNIILDSQTQTFTVANAGDRYPALLPGAHIYKMHMPYEITPECIFEILNNTEKSNLEFDLKYDLALDEIMYLEHADQLYGNCSWYSHQPAIEALIYLHHIHQGKTSDGAQALAHKQYLDWENFEKQHALEDYFDNHPALSIDAVLDILVEYQPSLFEGSQTVDPVEYERAAYLAKVLATDTYHDDFLDHFGYGLPYIKSELRDLFVSVDLISSSDELLLPPTLPMDLFDDLPMYSF